MSTSINTNIAAYYAQANLKKAGDAAQSSIARLSSGNAIVRASDNVAGLAIGTILRTNVSTLQTASSNASQGSTLLQIADGATSSLGEILQRQKALATQANSGTLSDTERGYLDQEFQGLTKEYNQIVSTTNFNGVSLLDGSLSSSGSVKTQAVTAANVTAAAQTGKTIDTSVITGGAAGFTVSTVGSGTDVNALKGGLNNAHVKFTDGTGTAGLSSLSLEINGVVFVSAADAVNLNATNTNVSLTSSDGTVIQLDIANQGLSAATQTQEDTFGAKLQGEIQKLNVYQNKAISKTAGADGAIVANDTNSTALQGLDGDDFTLKSGDFNTDGTAPSIGSFKVTYANGGASISATINGKEYSVVLGDLTNFKSATTNGAATGGVDLVSKDDANSKFTIDFSQLTGDISIASADDATKLQDSLNTIFGSGSSGGLNFQVGNNSSDQIGISLDSLSSANVFKDSTGVSQTLSISTAKGAQSASDILDTAIKTLTSARSDIGALQERFNYASDTLAVSIQNLDAARGSFLDTDISAESTKYATEQVQQQAAISVLAQANQLPQNLLKLIGQ